LLHRFAFGIAPSMTRAPDRNRGRRHSDIASSSDALTYTSRNDNEVACHIAIQIIRLPSKTYARGSRMVIRQKEEEMFP
jgi:hypothetical protein